MYLNLALSPPFMLALLFVAASCLWSFRSCTCSHSFLCSCVYSLSCSHAPAFMLLPKSALLLMSPSTLPLICLQLLLLSVSVACSRQGMTCSAGISGAPATMLAMVEFSPYSPIRMLVAGCEPKRIRAATILPACVGVSCQDYARALHSSHSSAAPRARSRGFTKKNLKRHKRTLQISTFQQGSVDGA